MSQQASRDNRRKSKKELRQEAIAKSKHREYDYTSESHFHQQMRDSDYSYSRNVLDGTPGGLM